MTKYHIKKDGTPGVCRAKNGNCPLGGSESHYDSMNEAQEAAQLQMEEKYGVISEQIDYDEKLDSLKKKLDGFKGSTSEEDALRTEISKLNEEIQGGNYTKGTMEDTLNGIHEPDGGATFNLSGIQPSTGFCASPYPEHSKVFNSSKEVSFNALAKYVKEIEEKDPSIFSQDETYLGMWNDPEDGKVYLDISKRYHTAEEARKACEDHDQIAFFDLNVFESVDVDRNAKSGQ